MIHHRFRLGGFSRKGSPVKKNKPLRERNFYIKKSRIIQLSICNNCSISRENWEFFIVDYSNNNTPIQINVNLVKQAARYCIRITR